jgi:hypothetical protein
MESLHSVRKMRNASYCKMFVNACESLSVGVEVVDVEVVEVVNVEAVDVEVVDVEMVVVEVADVEVVVWMFRLCMFR